MYSLIIKYLKTKATQRGIHRASAVHIWSRPQSIILTRLSSLFNQVVTKKSIQLTT